MGIKLYMQIFNVKERKIFDLFFVFFKYRITYNFSFYYILSYPASAYSLWYKVI